MVTLVKVVHVTSTTTIIYIGVKVMKFLAHVFITFALHSESGVVNVPLSLSRGEVDGDSMKVVHYHCPIYWSTEVVMLDLTLVFSARA